MAFSSKLSSGRSSETAGPRSQPLRRPARLASDRPPFPLVSPWHLKQVALRTGRTSFAKKAAVLEGWLDPAACCTGTTAAHGASACARTAVKREKRTIRMRSVPMNFSWCTVLAATPVDSERNVAGRSLLALVLIVVPLLFVTHILPRNIAFSRPVPCGQQRAPAVTMRRFPTCVLTGECPCLRVPPSLS